MNAKDRALAKIARELSNHMLVALADAYDAGRLDALQPPAWVAGETCEVMVAGLGWLPAQVVDLTGARQPGRVRTLQGGCYYRAARFRGDCARWVELRRRS